MSLPPGSDDWPRYRDVLVAKTCDGWPASRFLTERFYIWPVPDILRGIDAGEVVGGDGRPIARDTPVTGLEVLRVFIPGLAPSTPPPPFPPILYNDGGLVAVDKPSGLMMHPSGARYAWALIGLAKRAWPDEAVDLIHRLDRDTSGVVLLARNIDVNRRFKQALHDGEITKTYIARVRGLPSWDESVIELPIGRAGGPIRIQMAVRHDGKPARTLAKVLMRDTVHRESLLRLTPQTGRTHQLRVHMAAVGHPILGDILYGVGPDALEESRIGGDLSARTRASRLLLHARRLELHLSDRAPFCIEAPLPNAFCDRRGW